MSNKIIRQVLRLVVISIALGVCASEASAQSIMACEYQLSIDQEPCASGSAGEECRMATYGPFGLCLLGVIPDQVAANPQGFCSQAQVDANQCWLDYESCGGLSVYGCWETYYYVCRAESGIDYCQ